MKTTLITGASTGIGEAVARQLAKKNHHLLLVARNEQKLQTLAKELNAQYVVADLSQPDAAEKIYQQCQERNLEINYLINNAGIGSSGEFYQNNLPAELSLLQLNNTTLVSLCHLFLPAMIKEKQGHIINVGSMASFMPISYMAVYAASKAFVRSFTIALTEECRPYGVHVMLFCPGLTTSNFMNTPDNKNTWGQVLTAGAPTQTPEEVATELIQALEKNKTIHISSRLNKLTVQLSGLIPEKTATKIFAARNRKKMNL